MAVTAEAVKVLRERTGAGMMECKKALVETNGDLEAAAELMRKSGLAKADKKATRVAAEGVVVIERSGDHKRAAIVEVNCETDFVAREKDFQSFAAGVAKVALTKNPTSLEALLAASFDGSQTVDEVRRALIAKIGENIGVRRFSVVEAPAVVGAYLHGTRIGALVAMKSGDEALPRTSQCTLPPSTRRGCRLPKSLRTRSLRNAEFSWSKPSRIRRLPVSLRRLSIRSSKAKSVSGWARLPCWVSPS